MIGKVNLGRWLTDQRRGVFDCRWNLEQAGPDGEKVLLAQDRVDGHPREVWRHRCRRRLTMLIPLCAKAAAHADWGPALFARSLARSGEMWSSAVASLDRPNRRLHLGV